MLYKNWQVPCILQPNPNTSCRFCYVSISPQSLHWWWPPESHIPTCFITIFPFCVLVSVLHQCEIISTSPASFLLSSSFFTVAQVLTQSVCLRAALQVSDTFIFHISTTFCCGFLWKLREEKGGSMYRWENAPPLPCLIELCLSVQILWRAQGKELFTRFRVMFYTGQQKELVYFRNWNYLMFDHLQPQATFFSSCAHHCERNMGLIP